MCGKNIKIAQKISKIAQKCKKLPNCQNAKNCPKNCHFPKNCQNRGRDFPEGQVGNSQIIRNLIIMYAYCQHITVQGDCGVGRQKVTIG